MKLRCIIAEDEPLAVDKLKRFVEQVSFLKLEAVFDNGMSAFEYLKNNKADLVFLDIRMNKLTGIELLESLSDKPNIIITTAYSEYAVKSFELNVIDYLLKPFSFSRFLQAVNKVYDIYNSNANEFTNSIFVKTEYRIEQIKFDEILYIESQGDYLQLVCETKKIMTLSGFNEIQKKIPSSLFVRVHRSYIVSLDKIKTIERNRVIIGNKYIPISNTYKDFFFSVINGE